ncbi:MAG TPA: cytochrome c maturation protein CcmE [Acidimicrobiales bacterium]|nr:cytochrome c maturation protein CcmE [Acidimicrobiales bacterium]
MSIDTSRGLPDSELDPESSDAGTFVAAAPPPARSTLAPSPPRRRPRTSRSQRRRMWVVGVVILGAIGFLVYKGLTSALVFFKTANEAVAQRAQLGNSDFQMEGDVVNGSVHHVGGDVYRFAVVSSGVAVEVENTGYPPQMFKPGLPVVVVGHFVGSSNLFASDEIMVKHSAAYIAAHPNRVKPAAGSSP